MENNNIITGRISSICNDGMSKTYEESFFKCFFVNNFKKIIDSNPAGMFLNKKNGKIIYTCYDGNMDDIIEELLSNPDLEKISIIKWNEISNTDYICVEFINSLILHQHLVDERMIIEGQMNGRTL